MSAKVYDPDQPAIPGTVHLVDLQGNMNTAHASGSTDHDIVLVPEPSSDPDDPLNWTPARKRLSTFCMCTYTLMVGIASAAIYSILEPISKATVLTLDDLNNGTGCMFLFFGWGSLIWQPLAQQYGKRPVFLLSILATAAIQMWAPYTTTKGQWIANKILQGFFGAPLESLCEISVADIYFQHERGRYIALYGFFLAGSNFFAPIIAGFIDVGQSWQWVLYWCAIFNLIGFVFLFFFMEETNYPGRVPRSLEHGKINDSPDIGSSPRNEKGAPSSPQIHELDISEPVGKSTKPYYRKLGLVQRRALRQPNHILQMMWRPLYFLSFPVIAWAGFAYGCTLIWFNVLNGTASLILTGPPYNFKPSLVGVAYVGPLIGVGLANIYTGLFGDKFVLRMARKNGGILESEHRLWLFMASVIIVPFSLLLWGVGAAHGIHWFGEVFAMTLLGANSVIGLQLALSYCIDSYYGFAAESTVSVIIVRNTMGFAIGYGLTPWVTNMGLQNAFIVAAFAGMAECLTFLFFIKYGKGLRVKSRARYERLMVQMKKDGVAH